MTTSPSPFDRMKRSRRAPSRLWVWWVLLAVLLVGATLFFRQQVAGVFWQVAAPAVRLRESLGEGEVARLRAELSSTSALLADRNALYKENLGLKERLGRADPQAPRILAGVLQRPPWVPYDTLLIDAGSAHGLAVGDLVFAGGQALVGSVVEVQDTTARVELLSAPGQSYQALLGGSLPVAVEGQGGGSMRAEVPAGTQVAVGDTVQFPGLAGGISALVSGIDERFGESFIVIYMSLPANPGDLRFVEVATQ